MEGKIKAEARIGGDLHDAAPKTLGMGKVAW